MEGSLPPNVSLPVLVAVFIPAVVRHLIHPQENWAGPYGEPLEGVMHMHIAPPLNLNRRSETIHQVIVSGEIVSML